MPEEKANHKTTISVATIAAIIASLAGNAGYGLAIPARTPHEMTGMDARASSIESKLTELQATFLAHANQEDKDRNTQSSRNDGQDRRTDSLEHAATNLNIQIGRIEDNTGMGVSPSLR